jgi:hypothetical protein
MRPVWHVSVWYKRLSLFVLKLKIGAHYHDLQPDKILVSSLFYLFFFVQSDRKASAHTRDSSMNSANIAVSMAVKDVSKHKELTLPPSPFQTVCFFFLKQSML